MKTIAFETSSKTFSIAAEQDGKLLGEVFWDCGMTHSEKLVPSLNWLLSQVGWKKADIEKAAVSTGPGSFTGIRVGISCARMIAQSLNIPAVGVDTLAAIKARAAFCGKNVIPLIDALRGEIYVYDGKGGVIIVEAGKFISSLKKQKGDIVLAGSGAVLYEASIRKALGSRVSFLPYEFNLPRASGVLKAVSKMKPVKYDKIMPLYIRKSWAEENTNTQPLKKTGKH